MQRETIGQTFKVATLLCLVCSFVVSLSAVGLRERQQANRERERKKNILIAASLFRDEHGNADVARLFKDVQARIVNLDDGTFNTDIEPETFDQLKEAKEAKPLPAEQDVAGIKSREEHSLVYLVSDEKGKLDQLVLPIRGYGLWSTLYGFIALDVDSLSGGADQLEVRGLTFYRHAETPGLGGEVDNPLWKAKWKKKKVFDKDWNVQLAVVKQPSGDYQVDSLSGATLTARGVSNMIEFWLGENGFKEFLKVKPFLESERQNAAVQRPVGEGNG